MNLTYDSLYDEYGKENTNRTRRQLTHELNRPPTWLELMMRLAHDAGPVSTPPPKKEIPEEAQATGEVQDANI